VRSSVDLLLRAAFCLVAIQNYAEAQQAITSATLGGRVEDTSGSVVGAANIEARDLDRGRILSQAADSHGRFQFLHLAPGEYSITVSAPRFKRVQRRVSLSLGQALEMSVVLPLAGRQDAVEVTERVELIDSARTRRAEASRRCFAQISS
jgi:hypothetical protein